MQRITTISIYRNLKNLPRLLVSQQPTVPPLQSVQVENYSERDEVTRIKRRSKVDDITRAKASCKSPPAKSSPVKSAPPSNDNSGLLMGIAALGAAGFGFYIWNQNQNHGLDEKCAKDEYYSLPSYAEPPVSIPCKNEIKKTSNKLNSNSSSNAESSDDTLANSDLCPELPSQVPYLIVGAGTAAFAASKSIRANDPSAKVLMIGEECNLPYLRPPLSKELWFNETHKLTEQLKYKLWNGKERSIFYENSCYYLDPKDLMKSECGGISVALGRKVKKLDVECNKVILDNNVEVCYDKILIATGGKPRQHPIIAKSHPDVQKRTILFRKIVDFQKLDCVTVKGKSVAIIGGGFLGTELAVALGNRAKRTRANVYQIFGEKGNMGKILPDYLAKWTMAKVRKENVNVIPESSLKCARMCGDKVALTLSNGQEVQVDHVVVAIGLEPEVSIADCSGLETDKNQGGFLVNAEMKAREDVWVAGDAASFYDVKLGRRRIEHHDHAVVSGRLAGENMVGKSKPYWHQSMFWSDLGSELGFEAIGIVDSTLPTTAVFAQACLEDTPQAVVESTDENIRSETEDDACVQARADSFNSGQVKITKPKPADGLKGTEDFGKGIIFYLRDKVIIGMVMWNVFNKMPIARKILREQKEHDDLSQVAKLFELHSNDIDEKN